MSVKAIRSVQGRWTMTEDAPVPVAGPGEVVVRTVRAALHRADVATQGRSFIPGRECTGVIESGLDKAGKPVAKDQIGKRVCIAPAWSCGTCDRCRSGLGIHCKQRTVLSETRDGCLAEFIAVPQVATHELPATVRDDDAALATSLAAAAHLARALPATSKPFITVLGDNAVGLLAAQLISRKRDTVRLLTDGPAAATVCEKWGLKHRPSQEAGRRGDQDVVLEVTGTVDGLRLALHFVRPRGKILLSHAAGFRTSTVPADVVEQIARQEIEVVGVRGEDFAEAMSILGAGSIELAPLITMKVGFENVSGMLNGTDVHDQLKTIVAMK
jgi:threonine dehydrogenase-like Zn-dependent dehydrogenase